jgi:hypothetical protein
MKLIENFLFEIFLSISGAGIIYFILYLPYTILINYSSQVLAWHKFVAVRKILSKIFDRII